jgi:hypothetical protein
MTEPEPHDVLAHGDLVFDSAAPWNELRGGQLRDVDGRLSIYLPARTKEERKQAPNVVPVDSYPGKLKRHLFMGQAVGDAPDPKWSTLYAAVLRALRDAPGRQLPLATLQASLTEN